MAFVLVASQIQAGQSPKNQENSWGMMTKNILASFGFYSLLDTKKENLDDYLNVYDDASKNNSVTHKQALNFKRAIGTGYPGWIGDRTQRFVTRGLLPLMLIATPVAKKLTEDSESEEGEEDSN